MESRYSRKSFVSRMKWCNWCGIPAEKGCFIFSIINMIIVSACVAACIYYIVWIEQLDSRRFDGLEVFFNRILCTILCVGTGISFIFAVLLCHGAYKRRPKFILAYFIFGAIVEIFTTGGFIYYLIVVGHNLTYLNRGEVIFISVMSTIIAIYPLALTLVYRAYRVLSDSPVLPSGYGKLMHNYPTL